MAKSINLDAARAARSEALEEAPTLLFKGVEFKLPIEIPFAIVESAATIVAAERSGEDDDERGGAAAAAIAQMARALLGEEYDKFLALGPSMSDMNLILESIGDLYAVNLGESQASES